MNTSNCNNNNIDKFKSVLSNHGKFLQIIHFNAQGLLEGMHLEHIHEIVNELNLDIIAISETWLNQNIRNKTIAINGYQMLRSDRNIGQEVV